ncbi:MAG: prohibitin family protein [Anaerolineaceae bacterium]|nr:prohibitin family protein [Anaerolineaceae bacterium]
MNIANLVGAVATVAWLAVVGVVVLVVLRAARNNPLKAGGTFIAITIVLAILLSAASAGIVFIYPEERGVVVSAVQSEGYREKALEPGLSWIIPFAENVIRYPISKQTYTMSIAAEEGQIQGDDSIEARTSDGQVVLVDASVIYHINYDQVVKVHIEWQDRYSTDLVRALSRGVIRDAASQFGVEEVYGSKRMELVKQITDEMDKKLTENGLVLVDFVLRNISFSPEYSASVEQKQIAEQQAQQAKFVVESRKQEAEQARQVAEGQADAAVIEAQGRADARIIEAKAEANALLQIAAAIEGNTDLLIYQYISKLTPSINTMLLPSDSPFLFPLPEMQDRTYYSENTPNVVPPVITTETED